MAADTIEILDPLTNAHTAAGSLMWFIDSATTGSNAVAQYNVAIPFGVSRVRVVYDSTHATAANVACRCRLSKVTAVS